MDGLKVLYPPPPADGGTEEDDDDAAVARRQLHRARNARPARRGRVRPREEAAEERGLQAAVEEEEEDAARAFDRVSIAKLGHAKAKTNFPVAEYRAEWAELEALGVDGAAALMREHAAAERQDAMNKASRFRGVSRVKGRKTKPWVAQIKGHFVTQAVVSDFLSFRRTPPRGPPRGGGRRR